MRRIKLSPVYYESVLEKSFRGERDKGLIRPSGGSEAVGVLIFSLPRKFLEEPEKGKKGTVAMMVWNDAKIGGPTFETAVKKGTPNGG